MSVGKDGQKFKPWDFKVLLTPAPGTDPKRANVFGSGRKAPRAADIRFDEDHLSVEAEGCDGFRHHRGELSMRQLAFYLSYDLDRPVVDLTGLAGTYDIMLDFPGDPATGGVCPTTAGDRKQFGGGAPFSAEKIIGAVHAQLGLNLEATRSVVDVLVIDRIEKQPLKSGL